MKKQQRIADPGFPNLRKREDELTAQLLETGGELGKLREHNSSLRAQLARLEGILESERRMRITAQQGGMRGPF